MHVVWCDFVGKLLFEQNHNFTARFQEHSRRFKIEHETVPHLLTLSDQRVDRPSGQKNHIRPNLLVSDASTL